MGMRRARTLIGPHVYHQDTKLSFPHRIDIAFRSSIAWEIPARSVNHVNLVIVPTKATSAQYLTRLAFRPAFATMLIIRYGRDIFATVSIVPRVSTGQGKQQRRCRKASPKPDGIIGLPLSRFWNAFLVPAGSLIAGVALTTSTAGLIAARWLRSHGTVGTMATG